METKVIHLYQSMWRDDPAFKQNMSPLKLGVIFFVAALLFTLAAYIYDRHNADQYPYYFWNLADANAYPSYFWYLTDVNAYPSYFWYLSNISWSISLVAIFPAVIGLIHYYYQKAPQVLLGLYNNLVKPENPDEYQRLCDDITKNANSIYLTLFVVIVVIAFNLFYFLDLLQSPHITYSWMIVQDYWLIFEKRFTVMGGIAAFIQVLLSYWVLMFLGKNLIFIHGLYQFFNSNKLSIKLDPLHPDGVSGLGSLRDLATLQATILLFFGFYASLKVIDKIYMQKESLLTDIGNPEVLIVYAIAAPLLFFLILGSAHKKMREAREEFLRPMSIQISSLLHRINNTVSASNSMNKENIELLNSIQQQYASYSQQISLWPFNWRSMQGFFGAVITPVIPPIAAGISYVVKLLEH